MTNTIFLIDSNIDNLFVLHLKFKSLNILTLALIPWLYSLEAELVAHLNSCGFAFHDWLQNLISTLARRQLNCEFCDALGFILDVQVLNLHVKDCRKRLFPLSILEVEDGALSCVKQLVKGF